MRETEFRGADARAARRVSGVERRGARRPGRGAARSRMQSCGRVVGERDADRGGRRRKSRRRHERRRAARRVGRVRRAEQAAMVDVQRRRRVMVGGGRCAVVGVLADRGGERCVERSQAVVGRARKSDRRRDALQREHVSERDDERRAPPSAAAASHLPHYYLVNWRAARVPAAGCREKSGRRRARPRRSRPTPCADWRGGPPLRGCWRCRRSPATTNRRSAGRGRRRRGDPCCRKAATSGSAACS